MKTFKILEETTIKYVLTGILKNTDSIRSALGLQGYQLSINSYRDQNITVVIATKSDDNVVMVVDPVK